MNSLVIAFILRVRHKCLLRGHLLVILWARALGWSVHAGCVLEPFEMNQSSYNGVASTCSAAYRMARCPHSTPTFLPDGVDQALTSFLLSLPISLLSLPLTLFLSLSQPHHLFMEHVQLPLLMAGNDTWTQKWQWVVSTHQLGTKKSAWASASALCQLRCSGLINTGQCDQNALLHLEYIGVNIWYIKHLMNINFQNKIIVLLNKEQGDFCRSTTTVGRWHQDISIFSGIFNTFN